jgi:ubiquinone/menaquinone biosynthesis C-methylase UbiE
MAARKARGHHGNPADVKRMIRRQLHPRRAEWQKPEAVVRALGLRRGDVVADVGAGPGFWTGRLARAVGRAGHVYAVDPEPALLEVLRHRLDGVRNVTPVLNRDDDPMLPPGRCDVALIVNAYHHFADAPAFLRRLARCLKPGGRLANIDWADHDTPQGPPANRRVPPATFLQAARRAGFTLVAEHDFLPQQYFFVLRRGRPRR